MQALRTVGGRPPRGWFAVRGQGFDQARSWSRLARPSRAEPSRPSSRSSSLGRPAKTPARRSPRTRPNKALYRSLGRDQRPLGDRGPDVRFGGEITEAGGAWRGRNASATVALPYRRRRSISSSDVVGEPKMTAATISRLVGRRRLAGVIHEIAQPREPPMDGLRKVLAQRLRRRFDEASLGLRLMDTTPSGGEVSLVLRSCWC